MSDVLDRATAAIRETSGDDAQRAAATRLRLRRSLEQRAKGRRHLTSIGIVFGVLFGGTTAWALATGQAERVWSALTGRGDHAEVPVIVGAPAQRLGAFADPDDPPASSSVVPDQPSAPPAIVVDSVETPASTVKRVAAPASTTRRPIARMATVVPTAEPGAAPVEALYVRAHELHFRGADPAAALAAWDAYLAAEPAGRFAIEARYNRGLMLIRIGRYREARDALLPFATGEVTTAGYRQDEASQLVRRLARLNDR